MRLLAPLATVVLAACAPELDWREVTSSDGQFEVLLPGKPAHEARTVALAGDLRRMDMLTVQVTGMAFGVGYARLPANADAARVIDEARSALVRNIGGRVLAVRPVDTGDARGIEFEAEGSANELRMQLAARMLVSGGVFYQIVFIGRGERAGEVDTALFLRSFKLRRGASGAVLFAPEGAREHDEQREKLEPS